jgi:pyridoxal phosphate enzyme (YggS family)
MIEAAAAIEARIERVRKQIVSAATRVGRDASDVTLVAVSKTVGREIIDAAYAAGLRHFGENRVQDAWTKFATPLPGDSTLHMIGQLQTNKAGHAVRLFQQVDSVDRLSLVHELQKQGAKLDRHVPVLLQVNVAREEQKAGCAVEDAAALVAAILGSRHLELRGLMTIAPFVSNPEDVRPVFRQLRELRDRLLESTQARRLPALSMGMSNDYSVAIEEGATHVRIGRAIFGD